MTQKQLANVLVKILGLSFFMRGIPELITGVLNFSAWAGIASNSVASHSYPNFMFYSGTLIAGLAQLAIGIFLIIRSHCVVEKLFKDGEE
jgi:hypothetical protein